MTTETQGIRLNKFISETGLCSRREADQLIEDGLVKVNGRVADMGVRVTSEDHVQVRGKPLKARPAPVYLAYNKPVGITCTTDPEVPENIVRAVNYKKGRIFPIGRLDKPSEGLILLTNDGDIVNRILRAGNAHEKEYVVAVDRPFGPDFVQRMSSGIPILGTVTLPCKVRQLSANSFNIILTQGLNRQIRRMTEYLGYEVTRLKRTRIMNISLGDLKPGQWRLLNQKEMAQIQAMIADSSGTEEASQVLARPARKLRPRPEAGATATPANRRGSSRAGQSDGRRADTAHNDSRKPAGKSPVGKKPVGKKSGKKKGAGGKSIKRP
ncbi:23S rRNA pseudouridine(2604) synthase RluF [Marinospirillum alkaliphilum]|uniref:Pseudouridine synthase n=1 Tax=Marinospirillum alkaliphilum DSM 21637 TaxID=1122209 RepID=A0A1K1X658_9GAMM|nr:23S rRNA pseudouridine(2604) synthase RluF [Marinospirillum alkaliphilum]SFX44660.1 23S rRNA pseudouridine2604 synthase [Marinospirillum alkaliphilum DSM 21637]